MDWILSFSSALMLWLMGNKSVWGPRVGLVVQVLWMYYAIATRAYGLIPGVIMFSIIHLRNSVLWQKP